MEALEIESQTDQAPLARCRMFTTQGELTETKHLFDDPDDRFDGAFASSVDGFAHCCLELVGHLDQGARVIRWWSGQWSKTLLPTGMMGITASGNVGFDAALRTGSQRCGTRIAGIQCRRLRRADCWWDGRERGFGFLAIVGVIGESPSHDEQTPLIHSNLCVVILLKTSIRRVFHDARLGVSKVVLICRACSWHRWGRWATTGAASRLALPRCTLRHLLFILRLLGCHALLGTSFEHRFCLRQPRQAVLAPCYLFVHH